MSSLGLQEEFNHELPREQQYDIEILTETVPTTIPQLNI